MATGAPPTGSPPRLFVGTVHDLEHCEDCPSRVSPHVIVLAYITYTSSTDTDILLLARFTGEIATWGYF